MPTSKSSPTAGEISQNDIPDGTTETNFPTTDPTQPSLETATEQPEKWNPGKGETWAIWEGMQPGERVLTVVDLKSLG
jgi:hypothetical protein